MGNAVGASGFTFRKLGFVVLLDGPHVPLLSRGTNMMVSWILGNGKRLVVAIALTIKLLLNE